MKRSLDHNKIKGLVSKWKAGKKKQRKPKWPLQNLFDHQKTLLKCNKKRRKQRRKGLTTYSSISKIVKERKKQYSQKAALYPILKEKEEIDK
ncbi:hypothetical protein RMCBS344292_00946 [Rhizopus microsporus]|nr:hypothetical protein RMCBS344292_00946 [Rhizopus microsporus]